VPCLVLYLTCTREIGTSESKREIMYSCIHIYEPYVHRGQRERAREELRVKPEICIRVYIIVHERKPKRAREK